MSDNIQEVVLSATSSYSFTCVYVRACVLERMFTFVVPLSAPLSGSNLLLKNRFSVPSSSKDTCRLIFQQGKE